MYDGPEVSRGPIGPVNIQSPGASQTRRQRDRQRQTETLLHAVVRPNLREIYMFATMCRCRGGGRGVRSLKCRSLR